MITISTHNGSSVAVKHNLRDFAVVSKENHIDLTRSHETWLHEDVETAYERIFGEAVKAYNEKQKRTDRQISSYYEEVCKDERRHPVYEMIIGLYGDEVDDESGKDIMKKFVDTWEGRNPNLELIGAYYHADEEGVPHVHIDYIPVAHGYKRGMEMQAGLDKALREQGFESSTIYQTAQIAWEKRENAYLEELCIEQNFEVIHPDREKRKKEKIKAQHEKTEVYKARQEHVKINGLNEALLEKNEKLVEENRELTSSNEKLIEENGALKEENEKLIKEKEHYRKEATLMYEKYKTLETKIKAEIGKLQASYKKAKSNLDMVLMAMKDATLNVRKLLESALDKNKQAEYEANVTRDLKTADRYIEEVENLLEEDEEYELF